MQNIYDITVFANHLSTSGNISHLENSCKIIFEHLFQYLSVVATEIWSKYLKSNDQSFLVISFLVNPSFSATDQLTKKPTSH